MNANQKTGGAETEDRQEREGTAWDPPFWKRPMFTWKAQPLFKWYDLWVGFYWDRDKRWLYVFPLPCVGVKIVCTTRRQREEKLCEMMCAALEHSAKAHQMTNYALAQGLKSVGCLPVFSMEEALLDEAIDRLEGKIDADQLERKVNGMID